MTAPEVISTDGTRIHVTTAGDPANPPIVFVHGWAQHSICWRPVMQRLCDRFFVLACDLRGHGASDKPEMEVAYTDTKLWGDDIAAILAAYDLRNPVLCGWSYGSRAIAAYLETHGDAAIVGVVLAGGILATGTAQADWMVEDGNPGLDRDLYTNDQPRRLSATARFIDACTAVPLDRQTYGEIVGANMLVSPLVRRALFKANLDLTPVYAALTRPGLVIHGTQDVLVIPRTGRAIADAMPHGRFLPYEGIGHAPFLEAPDRFAADLAAFAGQCLKIEVAA